MYDTISELFGFLKVDPLKIDNNLFRLHYKVTMFILILFSLLVTQKQYFGDPIDCVSSSEISFLDTYCWIQSTYTLPSEQGTPYSGIGNPGHPGNREKRHHVYYQWVTLFLYIQALMFYIPWYIWRIFEGGKLKMLLEGLQQPIADENVTEEKKKFLIYFLKMNFNRQNSYAIVFFFCELLNFCNVIGQIFLTDLFVNYEFSTYGMSVLSETQNTFISRHDSLELVFPKVSKCDFTKQGPSGTVERYDALCVLPLNVFNEKLYIFLWFWFIVLAVVSGIGVIYRLFCFYQPFRRLLLKTRSKLASDKDIDAIADKANIGDWFLIYQIAKNMNELTFQSFSSDFAKEMIDYN